MRNVFLKQYGERRTGTNYLRALITANCPDAVVLMHILGDKHSPPVPFERHWENARAETDAAYCFVSSCTWDAPADSVDKEDVRRERHMRGIASALTEAYLQGDLKFLISVKHPRPWAASLARYSGWTLAEPNGVFERLRGRKTKITMSPRYADCLAAACRTFNTRYRRWLELHERFPNRSYIARHEDLLEDPLRVLHKMAAKFGLSIVKERAIAPSLEVQAPAWDCDPLMYGDEPFDPALYRKKKYTRQLTPALWDVVERAIDWDLAAQFGYKK